MNRLLAIPLLLFFQLIQAQDGSFSEAETAFRMARYDEAYHKFEEAGKYFKDNGEFGKYAGCNLKMAQCHLQAGSYQESLTLCRSTISYIEDVIPEDSFLIATAHMVLGENALNLGRNQQAQEEVAESLKLYPDKYSADLASADNLMGIVYQNNGNQQLARQHLLRALESRKNLFGDESIEVADVENNLALIYLQEQNPQAIVSYRKVKESYEQHYGTLHPKVSTASLNLSRAYAQNGDFFSALDQLDQAQQILERLYPGDHTAKAFAMLISAEIMEMQGNLNEALHQYEQALTMYTNLYGEKYPEVANTHALIGKIYQQQNEFELALTSYQNAIYSNLPDQTFYSLYELPSVTSYFNRDYLLSGLLSKAKALEAIHFERSLKARDLKSAIATYQLADTLINQIRQGRLSESDQLSLGEQARLIYENGISLSLVLADQPFHRAKFHSQAFDFCERSKSALLLNAIQETKAKSFAGIPQELIDLEDSLQQEITAIGQQISSGINVSNNQMRLLQYRQAVIDLNSKLEEEYPKYYELKHQGAVADIPMIQQNLADQQMMIAYFIGDQRLYTFSITNKSLKIDQKPLPEDFTKTVNGLRNGIKYKVDQTFSMSSKTLDQLLIPEIPNHIEQLILLPDGQLNTIPFETLLDADDQYLINRFSISYDFSASLWLSRQKNKEFPNDNILLVAPVDFKSKDQQLNSLPATRKETNDIKYIFKSSQHEATQLLQANASETEIKSTDFTPYRYLHFATHGVVNESKPELSRIFLWQDEDQDGSLYSGDIYNLEVNAELVSLSACETGLGKLDKGEGVMGLSRAFLYAGATNLLVSQWQVNDASTSDLMVEFYHQHMLADNRTPFHQALRKAKLSLINSEEWSSPYYWAPFVLIGQ